MLCTPIIGFSILLREMVISYWSVKIFSLESFPLHVYSISKVIIIVTKPMIPLLSLANKIYNYVAVSIIVIT